MAIERFVPYKPPSDLMPLHEIYSLLAQTGHRASRKMIERWVRDEQLDTVRRRGWVHVSYSDILLAHRDAVRAGKI